MTRTESPVACITYNHGESGVEALALTLYDAGFTVKALDLSTEEIPENCRLIVVYNPTSDFLAGRGATAANEIKKLEKFLAEYNSLMVFMSPQKPELPVFEEYSRNGESLVTGFRKQSSLSD